MTRAYLGTDSLYVEIRNEIEDMSDYLETDTLRRQANTVVRLTVVTVVRADRDGRHRHLRHEPVRLPEIPLAGAARAASRRASVRHRAAVLHAGEVEASGRFPRRDFRRAHGGARQVQLARQCVAPGRRVSSLSGSVEQGSIKHHLAAISPCARNAAPRTRRKSRKTPPIAQGPPLGYARLGIRHGPNAAQRPRCSSHPGNSTNC